MRGIWLAGDCVSSGSFIRAFLPLIRILNAATLVPNSLNSVRRRIRFSSRFGIWNARFIVYRRNSRRDATKNVLLASGALILSRRVASRSKEKCVSSSVD